LSLRQPHPANALRGLDLCVSLRLS
jgi:hypothetical protein